MLKAINLDPVKIFIYVSFLFLLWELYSEGYAHIPKIRRSDYLAFSLVLVYLAFTIEAIPWKILASVSDRRISLTDSFISIGISIFGKYIPGKLWSILGRSAFLAQHYCIPLSTMNACSFKGQLIVLWSGFLIGGTGMILIKPSENLTWAMVAVSVGTGILLFSNVVNFIWNNLGKLLGKKFIPLPIFNFVQLVSLLPFYIIQWLLWCLGFYLFTMALLEETVPILSGLSFALASVIGIISFLTPGGLGIREGIIVVSLIGFGIDTPNATTVSIASRLWFFSGEFLIFISALILSRHRIAKS